MPLEMGVPLEMDVPLEIRYQQETETLRSESAEVARMKEELSAQKYKLAAGQAELDRSRADDAKKLKRDRMELQQRERKSVTVETF